ncbi:MAG: hypothetical protein ABDH28_04360 [Brevinematia bacterium]
MYNKVSEYSFCFYTFNKIPGIGIVDTTPTGFDTWGDVEIVFEAERLLPEVAEVVFSENEKTKIGAYVKGSIKLAKEAREKAFILFDEKARKNISETKPLVLDGFLVFTGDLKIEEEWMEDVIEGEIPCKIKITEAYKGEFYPQGDGITYKDLGYGEIHINPDDLVELIPSYLGDEWEIVEWGAIYKDDPDYNLSSNPDPFTVNFKHPKGVKYNTEKILL